MLFSAGYDEPMRFVGHAVAQSLPRDTLLPLTLQQVSLILRPPRFSPLELLARLFYTLDFSPYD